MQAGIFTLLGIIVGSMATYLTQRRIAEKEREARKKALSAAFYGEIYALLRLAERRNYIGIVGQLLVFIDEHPDYNVPDSFLSMQFQDYFAVYRNNIQYIGELDPDITPLITDFYIKVFSLMEDMTGNLGREVAKAALAYKPLEMSEKAYMLALLKQSLQDDLSLAYNVIATGKLICEKLSCLYNFGYVPVLVDIPTLSVSENTTSPS